MDSNKIPVQDKLQVRKFYDYLISYNHVHVSLLMEIYSVPNLTGFPETMETTFGKYYYLEWTGIWTGTFSAPIFYY